MMALSGVSLKPNSKGPGLPTLPDSLTQFVHCVRVTLRCPSSDSDCLEAPSLGTAGCPR